MKKEINNIDLKNRKEKVDDYVKQIQNDSSEAKKILSNLQDLSAKKGIKKGIETFDRLRDNHCKREWAWFRALIIAGITLVGSIIYILCTMEGNNSRELIHDFIQKSLIIIPLLIFFKILLTKYNIERHLRIIYDHRSTVLSQYKDFENAIGDDHIAKNQFRLELAKIIFSDPQTGLIKEDSNDVNLNPIVTLVEKMAPK